MVSPDTVKLLKECNAGVKMGINAIEEVLPSVKDGEFRKILNESVKEHKSLGEKTAKCLASAGDDGKEPHAIARGMAWFKTNMMLAIEASDEVAADLLTDGCHMGIKSLNRYLNEYREADEEAKKLTEDIIEIEENLAQNIKKYL